MPSASSSDVNYLLGHLTRAIDMFVSVSEQHHGLFPSIVDRCTAQAPDQLPEPIPGQRNGDRSFQGCNLIHDFPLLATMQALGEVCEAPDYVRSVDRYLEHFATRCTCTTSGLFPWGEHAYWDLQRDTIGSSHQRDHLDYPRIHDHLRQAPAWLWEKLYHFNPKCVKNFALGLRWHFKSGEPAEYSRHACIDAGSLDIKAHPAIDVEGRPCRLVGENHSACDFPRHCGFYLFDTAFALRQYPNDRELLDSLKSWHDYWWRYADHPMRLLPLQSRFPVGSDEQPFAPAQTLSLGLSTMEAAKLIEHAQPVLAAEMFSRGQIFAEAFFAVPHDPQVGRWFITYQPDKPAHSWQAPPWGSRYGHVPLCYLAMQCLAAHRLTGHGKFLDAAAAMANSQVNTPVPRERAIPAMDFGLLLGMLADLYEQTQEVVWRDAMFSLASDTIEIFFDEYLPRGAQGYRWYDSQMGPAYLIHSLARVALLGDNLRDCPLAADYTAR